MRFLTLLIIFFSAGVYWWNDQSKTANDRPTVTALCFDESLKDKARIVECGATYEAGGERAEEALDTQLALYAKIRNFEDGRRAVTAAVENGLTAPRWLFWQAYFNEKRGVEQPQMAELIEQVKEHPQFFEHLYKVWSETSDEKYISATLEELNTFYNSKIWYMSLSAYNLILQGSAQNGFRALKNTVSLNPLNHQNNWFFLELCSAFPQDCPQLNLMDGLPQQKLSCENANQAWKHKYAYKDDYEFEGSFWLKIAADYGAAMLDYRNTQSLEHSKKILLLQRLLTCHEKKYLESQRYSRSHYIKIKGFLSSPIHKNLYEISRYYINNYS